MAAALNKNFKHIQTVTPDFAATPIIQYESVRTGLQVVLVKYKSLAVRGDFAVATEIHNDSGVPHTLEHLCFNGSKDFPYKGLLDKVASQQLAHTNAWTDVDCTNYTIKSIGAEAFLTTLPLYLDHILRPVLTDAAFVTEVHHITGEGKDSGVVYCEMQDHESEPDSIMDLEARRLLYPPGNGFRSETGGQLPALRELTVEDIRQYHKRVYVPKNFRVIVSGDVEIDQLLSVVEKFEDRILKDVPPMDAPFDRPWIKTAPTTIPKSIVHELEYPSSEEKTGTALVITAGPSHSDFLTQEALKVMTLYLSGSQAALFDKVLVHEEHLVGDVYTYIEPRLYSTITIGLTGVLLKNLDSARNRLAELTKQAATEPLDMDFLRVCLNQRLRSRKHGAEVNPNSAFVKSVIRDHLYEPRDGSHLHKPNSLIATHAELAEWTEKQWRELIQKWFLSPSITVVGRPSKALATRNREAEEARVKAQQEALGEAGLKEKAHILKDALAENERPIPDRYFDELPQPDLAKVKLIETTPARTGTAVALGRTESPTQSLVERDNSTKNNMFLHFEEYTSNFTTISLHIGAGFIPTRLKPLLPLYGDIFFATPIKAADGTVIPYDEVVKTLEDKLVEYSIGQSSHHPDLLRVLMVVEKERYAEALGLLKQHLFDAVIDPARIEASIKSILSRIPESKRDGHSMLDTLHWGLLENEKSIGRAQATHVRSAYYKDLRRLFKKNPDAIVEGIKELRELLHTTENMRAYVGGDVSKIDHPVVSWDAITERASNPAKVKPLADPRSCLSATGLGECPVAVMLPLKAADSSFAKLIGPGPDKFSHPDVAALVLVAEFMNITEGPLWQGLRGNGLVYGAYFSNSRMKGLIELLIYRSADPAAALAKAKEIVAAMADGSYPIEDRALEDARKAVLASLASAAELPAAAAVQAFYRDVLERDQGNDRDWGRRLLADVRAVTKEDVVRVIRHWLLPLFDPAVGTLMMVGPAGDAAETARKVGAEMKFGVTVKTTEELERESEDEYRFRPELERWAPAEGEEDSDGTRAGAGAGATGRGAAVKRSEKWSDVGL